MTVDQKKKALAGVAVAAVVILVGFFLYSHRTLPPINTVNPSVQILGNGQVRVFGHFACLPLKSGDNAEANCQLGLMTHEGIYYGLDTSKAKNADSTITPKDSVGLTGTFAPARELNSSKFKKQAIQGVLIVTEIGREG